MITVKLPKAAVAHAARKGKSAFHVVIAYEDFAAGHRAMDACKLLVSQLDGQVEFRSGMWKFDILRNSKLNQIAAEDAAAADAIIVATSQSGDLPAEVRRWMETWIPLKRGQTSVLLALIESSGDEVANDMTAYKYLRQAAASAEIDFLPQSISGGQPAQMRETIPSPRTGWSDRIVSRPAPEGWGLND